MKFTKVLKLLGIGLCAAALSSQVYAASFTRTEQYTEGKFTDVPENAWYASEVKSAYELGFMNGKGDNIFVPDGNVTVAEGITMASRVNAIYNGKTVAQKSGGNWYDMYIDYAKQNGIIADGEFDNYSRSIKRYEMAVLFENAMPDGYFTEKNNVTSIPDVAPTEDYYNELVTLYNAGIVMGSDDYGSFYPNNPIKRSETAAIINRVAIPENRLTGSLADYGDRPQAVYLIDDTTMSASVKGKTGVRSGWNYENIGSTIVDKDDSSTPILRDLSKENRVAINKPIVTQTKGKLVLESIFKTDGNGARVYFTSTDGKVVAELCTKDGFFHVVGKTDNKTDFAVTNSTFYVYMTTDLDAKKVYVRINGTELGTFDLSSDANDVDRMWYATTEADTVMLNVCSTVLYVNYAVNDKFALDGSGKVPFGWTVTGKASEENSNDGNSTFYDPYSFKIEGKGSASTKFDKVSGKFIFETYVLIPEYAKASFSLMAGDKTAVAVDASADGNFSSGEKTLRHFTNNVWQCVRVEGDMEKHTATLKIDGKKCAEIAFDSDFVDGIRVSLEDDKVLWFDDVKLYNYYDYVDYCPTPVPVNDDDYYVGMSVCSLWHEGTHFGWDCVSGYDEIQSVLGYYDEYLPEVADWEIKFMVEHGIDFQHFCWYLGGGKPGKIPRLSDALNVGYMNAKYSDMCDFNIMWENQGCGETNSDFFYNNVWPYWVDWYFTDSRYRTFENKAVLTIYRYSQFVTNMGGEEGAKKAIAFMREDIKKYGYDGIIILFSDAGTNGENNKKASAIGGDGLVSYTFGENSYSSAYQISCMTNAYKAGGIDLAPSVGVGFNDIGWTGGRTPNATLEEHTKVLTWARDTYLPMLAERSKEDWKGKFVFMTTWNEYGEGHYIMPANLNGFGYLDDIRSTFSSVSGNDDTGHYDVTPTDNQKARLGFLYSAKDVPMRRQYFETVEKKYPTERLFGWDFDNADARTQWKSMMNVKNLTFDIDSKAMTGETTTTDGAIVPVNQTEFKASDASYIHIQMMTDTTTAATVYFKVKGDSDWSAAKGYNTTILGDGKYHDLYIDLSLNKNWAGNIIGIRFDPTLAVCKFGVKTFEFLKPDENSGFNLEVDGTDVLVQKECVRLTDKEIYLAGDPAKGFYSLQNMYYEWNRWDGKLYIKASTGTEFRFTVGSDIATVDGKEVKLSEKVSEYDGLVVLPMKFIYDNAKITYTATSNGLSVKIRPGDYKKVVESRVENQFEFNVDGDAERWIVGCAQGSVAGGCMTLSATPATSTKTGFDVQMTNKSVSIDTSLYKRAEVRIRCTFSSETPEDGTLTLYFATNAETGLSESKTAKVAYSDLKPDADGFVTAVFDLSANEKWTGTANTIRLDPTNSGGFFEIDYIRILADKEAEEKIKEQQKAAEEKNKLLAAADDGAPFYIENADAEDVGNAAPYYSHNADVSIVEDPLNKGNHVVSVKCNKDTKQWVYVFHKTRFKPGVTYKVEFDYYVTDDTKGNPIENALPQVNFKYTDVKNGELTDSVDHNNVVGKVSTKDGWVHLEYTHTISTSSTSRDTDVLSFFTSPLAAEDGSYQNLNYMIDNIKVSVVEG